MTTKTKRPRISSNISFTGAIQSAADKASNEMKAQVKAHDPYADLSREIGNMTSRDTYRKTH